MIGTKFIFNALALLALSMTFTSAARADGMRSYISAGGSDSKQCTRAQPCRSFDGALAKTDEGGEIVALDSGTYEATTVTKSITLAAAPGADVSITVASGNAITISTGQVATVVLRGLRLMGPGAAAAGTRGIEIIGNISSNLGLSLHVEGCAISNFERGINYDSGVYGKLLVSDTVVRGNDLGMAVRIAGTDSQGTSISRSRMEKNRVGVAAYSGRSITVYDSVAAGNSASGFETSGGQLNISHCVVTRNGTGLSAPGGVIRIAHSTVTGNNVGLYTSGNGQIRSMSNNMVTDNDIDLAGAQGFSTFSAM